MRLTRLSRARRAIVLFLALALAALAGCNLTRAPDPDPEPDRVQPDRVITPTRPPVAGAPPAESAVPLTQAILFLGDSITEGWDVTTLYPGAVNAGRSGDVSAQVLARYREHYAGRHFDAIVILAGINDLASGVSVDTLRQNVVALAEEARPNARRLYLASLLPVSAGFPPSVRQRIVEMNAWLRNYAAGLGAGFIDYYPEMADANGHAIDAYFPDGLHPSPAGYAVMRRVLAAALG
jgi:lysophospholipase L1-like esterase